MIRHIEELLKDNPPGRPGSMYHRLMKALQNEQLKHTREQIEMKRYQRQSRHDDLRAEKEFDRLFPQNKGTSHRKPARSGRPMKMFFRVLAWLLASAFFLVSFYQMILDLIR